MPLAPLERARRYIAKCPPAVSGQGGHNATFHVAACLVHGFALGEPDAFALLSEYNRGCMPPWSERELRHKVESASRADFRSRAQRPSWTPLPSPAASTRLKRRPQHAFSSGVQEARRP